MAPTSQQHSASSQRTAPTHPQAFEPVQSEWLHHTHSSSLHGDLSEFARPSASPGAGLGSILGNASAAPLPEKQTQTSPGSWGGGGVCIPSRTPTCTGSAYMTGEQDVKLYMYDLSKGMAKTLAPVLGSWLSSKDFDGVWHSGVVVFGQEYYFNGDLVHVSPGETTWGSPTKVVTIGHTGCSRKALHQFVVDELRASFNKNSYDALHNNCNHFADRVCMYLCRRHIPDHILQQPEKLAKLPALRLLRPFLDQWLGAGEPGSDPVSVGEIEDEPHLSSPSRKSDAAACRKQGNIIRGVAPESDEAHTHGRIPRHRGQHFEAECKSGFVSSQGPQRSLRGTGDGGTGSPSRGHARRSAEDFVQELDQPSMTSQESCLPVGDDTHSKQPCWRGQCIVPRRSQGITHRMTH